jgi:hypothetical protein
MRLTLATFMLVAATGLQTQAADAPADPAKAAKDTPQPSPAEPKAGGSRTVRVHPLFFSSRASGAVGVIHELRVTVGGEASDRVRVGFFESEVGGTGSMWRAAGWTAALMASQLLEFDPRTTQVSFDVQGRIDGPSAGALMTIAVMAATRGDTVRADATMTGTINPDGMIGPVGGIVQKLEAAAKFGKKLVLIPIGTRFHVDPNTQKRVSLVTHGQQLGVEVRPIAHIWDAYEALTGAALPRAPSASPPVPSELGNQLMARLIVKWSQERYIKAEEKFKKISDDYKSEYADQLYETAQKYAVTANTLLQEGQFAAASQDMVYAASRMYMAMEQGRCLQTHETGGLDAMVRRLKDDGWLNKEVETVTTAFRFFKPKTLDQLAAYLEACDILFQGLVFQKHAVLFLEKPLQDDPKTEEDERFADILNAADYRILAWINLKLAMDVLEQADAYGGRPIPQGAPIVPMAQFYLRAAEANLEMLEETHIKSLAKAANVRLEAAEAAMVRLDENFAALRLTQRTIIPRLTEYFGENESFAWGLLAVSTSLHARSAQLVSTHYSLGVQHDKDGNVVSIARPRAFADWLDASDDQVRRSIAELRALKVDPTTCVQSYALARVASRRELWEQLTALDLYFRANTTAQVLKRLAKLNAGKPGNP